MLANYSAEYENIRALSSNIKNRVEMLKELSAKVENAIIMNHGKDLPSFSIEGGKAYIYSLYVKCEMQHSIYKQESIMNLLNIYCKNKHDYTKNIVRKLLIPVFSIPPPCSFSKTDIYNIYNFINNEFPSRVSHTEEKEHYNLCNILITFFDLFYNQNKLLISEEIITEAVCNSMKGQATGDSIGYLVEGQCRQNAEKYVKEVIEPENFLNHGVDKEFGRKGNPRYNDNPKRWAFQLGQYTDDTQLCREVFKTILFNNGEFNTSNFADRLITLMGKSGCLRSGTPAPKNMESLDIQTGIVGPGKTTRKTTQCLADGSLWENTGVILSSSGNGGCMRSAPLGALFFDQPLRLYKTVKEQCVGTHGSSKCVASSVMVAEATRLAIASKVYSWCKHLVYNPKLFCERLAIPVNNFDTQLAKTIKLIPEWLKETNEQALVCKITKKSLELGDSLWHDGNVISASTVQTSLFAVVCFLKYPDSYKNAISMVVRAGGDTDSVGAICGAISGARNGVNLNVNFHDQNNWGPDKLRELSIQTRMSVV